MALFILLGACSSSAPSGDAAVDRDEADANDGEIADAGADANDADVVDAAPDAAPGCGAEGDITRAFIVRTLRVAPTTIGSNLDGLDNSATANSVAGCRKMDGEGGIENQAAVFDTATGGVPSQVGQEGITSGTIALTFTVSAWNGTADDACVELALTGTGLVGATATITSIAGGVIDAALPRSSGWDITGTYGAALTIPFRGLHAHLVLDETLTELVLPASPTVATTSFLAGHVLYFDQSAASAMAHDFRPRLFAYLVATNQTLFQSYIDGVARNARDLHTIGGQRPCMNPGSEPTEVDADAISGALLLSTNAP